MCARHTHPQDGSVVQWIRMAGAMVLWRQGKLAEAATKLASVEASYIRVSFCVKTFANVILF